MNEPVFFTIFNTAIAIVLLIVYLPIYKCKNHNQLNAVLQSKPRLKLHIERKLSKSYMFPFALLVIAMVATIASIPDEIESYSDTHQSQYAYQAWAIIFLFLVLIFNVWKLRKIDAAPPIEKNDASFSDNNLEKASSSTVASFDLPKPARKTIAKAGGLLLLVVGLCIMAAARSPAFRGYVKDIGGGDKSAEITNAALTERMHQLEAKAPPQLAVEDNGVRISSTDSASMGLDTIAGRLDRITLPNGQSALALNGAVLFSGDDAQWQSIVRTFKLSGEREAILIASTGGRGTSCETLFFFLIANKSGVKPTPEFGTCSAEEKHSQDGDKVTIMLPKMGGNSVVVFDGTTITEDGKTVNMVADNDPSK